METIDDDSFTLPGRLLTGSPVASAQPAWVRTRAIDLLRSMGEFRVPTGRKQRLLLRLRPGSRRTFALLLPIVVGAFLMGIGGGIATAALTEWPARVVRSYWKASVHALPFRGISIRPRALDVRHVGAERAAAGRGETSSSKRPSISTRRTPL